MASKYHNLSDYDINSVPNGKGMKVGIVVSEWNKEITGALLDGAVNTLLKHGVEEEDIRVKTVPGSFELIFGASQMVKTDVNATRANNVKVYSNGNDIVVKGAEAGEIVNVYSVDGVLQSSTVADGGDLRINAKSGAVYIVKSGDKTIKVAL